MSRGAAFCIMHSTEKMTERRLNVFVVGHYFGSCLLKMDKILTVNDVAELLHVKPITVREMFRAKRLRAFKVGKSWRTTEKMLQEDIDALARGESPASLPAANGKVTDINREDKAGKTKNNHKAKNKKVAYKEEAPASREDTTAYPAKSEAPVGKDASDKRNDTDEDSDEDLQQFLF